MMRCVQAHAIHASSDEDDMPLLQFARLRHPVSVATALTISVQDRTTRDTSSTVQHPGQPEQADDTPEQPMDPQQCSRTSSASLNRGAAAMSLLEADTAPEGLQQGPRSKGGNYKLSLLPSDRFDLAVAAC
jgi:hypothetical protein